MLASVRRRTAHRREQCGRSERACQHGNERAKVSLLTNRYIGTSTIVPGSKDRVRMWGIFSPLVLNDFPPFLGPGFLNF